MPGPTSEWLYWTEVEVQPKPEPRLACQPKCPKLLKYFFPARFTNIAGGFVGLPLAGPAKTKNSNISLVRN